MLYMNLVTIFLFFLPASLFAEGHSNSEEASIIHESIKKLRTTEKESTDNLLNDILMHVRSLEEIKSEIRDLNIKLEKTKHQEQRTWSMLLMKQEQLLAKLPKEKAAQEKKIQEAERASQIALDKGSIPRELAKKDKYYAGIGVGSTKLRESKISSLDLGSGYEAKTTKTGHMYELFMGYNMRNSMKLELGIKNYPEISQWYQSITDTDDSSLAFLFTFNEDELTASSALSGLVYDFSSVSSDPNCADDDVSAVVERVNFSAFVPYIATKISREFQNTHLYLKPGLSFAAKQKEEGELAYDNGCVITANKTESGSVYFLAMGSEYAIADNTTLGLEYAISTDIANVQALTLHLAYNNN